MDTKKSKSSKKLTSNTNLLLTTPVGQKLYSYAKERKPVLLYGKDTVGRGSLVGSFLSWTMGTKF